MSPRMLGTPGTGTETKREAAARLSRRFGRLVATVAWRDHHAGVDSVFDLFRMLRVPGTFNYKNPRPHRAGIRGG